MSNFLVFFLFSTVCVVCDSYSDSFSFAVVSDIHIGSQPGRSNYFEQIISKINKVAVDKNVEFLLVLGDMTDSGLEWEFNSVKGILADLNIFYVPIPGILSFSSTTYDLGNHDITYDKEAEKNFVDAFGDLLGNTTEAYKRQMNDVEENESEIHLQNFVFKYRSLRFIHLDWNRRYNNPNPGNSYLHNRTLWFLEEQLQRFIWGEESENVTQVVLISHHPFSVPKWLQFLNPSYADHMSFEPHERSAVEEILLRVVNNSSKLWGNMGGHFHYDITDYPFDALPNLKQVETKACCLDSSFIIFNVFNGEISSYEHQNAEYNKFHFYTWEFLTYFFFFVMLIVGIVLYCKNGPFVMVFMIIFSPIHTGVLLLLEQTQFGHWFNHGIIFSSIFPNICAVNVVVAFYYSLLFFLTFEITNYSISWKKGFLRVIIQSNYHAVMVFFIFVLSSFTFPNAHLMVDDSTYRMQSGVFFIDIISPFYLVLINSFFLSFLIRVFLFVRDFTCMGKSKRKITQKIVHGIIQFLVSIIVYMGAGLFIFVSFFVCYLVPYLFGNVSQNASSIVNYVFGIFIISFHCAVALCLSLVEIFSNKTSFQEESKDTEEKKTKNSTKIIIVSALFLPLFILNTWLMFFGDFEDAMKSFLFEVIVLFGIFFVPLTKLFIARKKVVGVFESINFKKNTIELNRIAADMKEEVEQNDVVTPPA